MTGWYLLALPLCGLGAVGRVLVTQATEQRLPGGAPTATALINVVGAALMGMFAAVCGDVWLMVLGGGLLGGFTTFSTWMVEVDSLHRAGRWRHALLLLVAPMVAGIGAFVAARSLFG